MGRKPKINAKRKKGDGVTSKQIAAIAARRKRVAELVLCGWSQTRIGEEVGVCRQMVAEDVKAVHEEWKLSRIHDHDAVIARELESLAKMEAEAWGQWERSKEMAVTRKHKESTNDQGGDVSDETTEKEQCGDPAYLAAIHKVRERRAALLGLDSPTKIAPTTPDGSKPFEAALDSQSTEALLLLAKLRTQAAKAE
jgi:predicted transcriptional regulator